MLRLKLQQADAGRPWSRWCCSLAPFWKAAARCMISDLKVEVWKRVCWSTGGTTRRSTGSNQISHPQLRAPLPWPTPEANSCPCLLTELGFVSKSAKLGPRASVLFFFLQSITRGTGPVTLATSCGNITSSNSVCAEELFKREPEIGRKGRDTAHTASRGGPSEQG